MFEIFFKRDNHWLDIWFRYDERLRFIIMAAANMAFRYGLFVVLEVVLVSLSYQAVLALMWLISSVVAFYSYKKMVFVTKGNHLKEYSKSILIWVISYVFNAYVLSVLVGQWHWNIFVAQAVAILFLLVSNYLLFKHFAFKKDKVYRWWEKMFDVCAK